MAIHLIRDLENLQREVLQMCTMVESLIHKAVDALCDPRGVTQVSRLAEDDEIINRKDVQIEEECLKILALHQPVAADLRRTAAVLKITGELERVADLGVNIAERAAGIAISTSMPLPEDIREMSEKSLDMLHRSIDAFVELDANAARQVCADDDIVDRLNDKLIKQIKNLMENPAYVEPALHLFSAVRQLERVADHATNIAEDVVYLVEGEIIRHQTSFPAETHDG